MTSFAISITRDHSARISSLSGMRRDAITGSRGIALGCASAREYTLAARLGLSRGGNGPVPGLLGVAKEHQRDERGGH